MAALERVEQVIAYLMAAPEVNKSPAYYALGIPVRQELTPVSHHTQLGIHMMGRETEAHLIQVRKIQALHMAPDEDAHTHTNGYHRHIPVSLDQAPSRDEVTSYNSR
jgi:hypothetical protein